MASSTTFATSFNKNVSTYPGVTLCPLDEAFNKTALQERNLSTEFWHPEDKFSKKWNNWTFTSIDQMKKTWQETLINLNDVVLFSQRVIDANDKAIALKATKINHVSYGQCLVWHFAEPTNSSADTIQLHLNTSVGKLYFSLCLD